MRFASQLPCFPLGAHSQSQTPVGRHAGAMGDGKGAAGSGEHTGAQDPPVIRVGAAFIGRDAGMGT